jgi:predicted Zn-dependent peptidase
MSMVETHQLTNGLRIVYTHHPGTPVTHCALMIKAGSRDEIPGQEGLAHFIEHALFKGTKKRKSYHILNRLEVVGGELNAYTTKEETCIHASVMNQYLDRAVELITDIIFNSVFPEKEIEKEKDVILDEIRSYMDTPYEQIFDDFENLIFKGHALGHPILGYEESLLKIKRRDLLAYIKTCYHPSRMVFSVSGSCGIAEVVKLAEKYFKGTKGDIKTPHRASFKVYKPVKKNDPRTVAQVHYISGMPGFSYYDPDRYVLVLLNNLLGGPGMNSRLNLNIREKYGFTYTIESGYHAYSDSGIFHVYFATDQRHFEKTKKLVEQELDKLRENTLSEKMFSQYKEQMLGQIMMAQENRLSVMLSITKGLLYFDRIISLKEIMDRIKVITPQQIRSVSGRLLSPKKHSTLVYEPK